MHRQLQAGSSEALRRVVSECCLSPVTLDISGFFILITFLLNIILDLCLVYLLWYIPETTGCG